MPMHHRVAGTWKAVTPWIKVGGVWKKAAVWHKVGGVWKQITSALAAYLTTVYHEIVEISPTDAVAGFHVSNNGYTYLRSYSSPSYAIQYPAWLTAGTAASEFDVRWTVVSGSPGGSATGTWLNCGTSREWTVTNTSNSNSTVAAVGTVEIREAAAPNTVLASATVTIRAVVEV